jgi:hypothetical protein
MCISITTSHNNNGYYTAIHDMISIIYPVGYFQIFAEKAVYYLMLPIDGLESFHGMLPMHPTNPTGVF